MSRVSAVTGVGNLRLVDRERAAGKDLERAGVEQVIQLHGDAAPVRFVDAEANRAESRRQKRRCTSSA